MTQPKRASAFPPTVRPGIPRLGDLPIGWTRSAMGDHLFEERRPVKMNDHLSYDLVTVRRARGGVVKRETLLGRDISVKTQFEIQGGDFLISKRQIVHGACGVVPDALHGSTVSNEYSVLKVREGLDLQYLKHLAHSVYFQQTCFHSSIGVHIEKMIFKLDQWLKWQFDLPPIEEQRRIAEILSAWDKAIEVTVNLIAACEAQKRALMQQLLRGQKRLPGFDQQWRDVSLGQLGEIVYGSSPKNIKSLDGKYPIIGTGGQVGLTNQFVCDHDSVVIGRKGTIDKPQFVEGPFWAIDTTYFFVPTEETNIRWLFYQLSSLRLGRYNEASGVPSLSRETLKKITIKAPNRQEQSAIAAVLKTSDLELTTLSRKLTTLRKEKSALIQQLLSGKRRVANREVAV